MGNEMPTLRKIQSVVDREKVMRHSKQRHYYDNNAVSKRIVSEQHLKQALVDSCLYLV